MVGYSIDYLKAVAKEAGLNVEFRNTAWDGIFAALESRQADIIASSVTITDKRKKAMGFSDPYCEIRQAVVVSTNSDLKNLKELDGKKVGGQIGTTGLVETLPKAKSKAIVKTYDEVGLALEDLAKGNIDAVICDDPVAKFYANKKQEYAGKLKVAFITDDVEFSRVRRPQVGYGSREEAQRRHQSRERKGYRQAGRREVDRQISGRNSHP